MAEDVSMAMRKFLRLFLNLSFIFLVCLSTYHFSSNLDLFNYPKRSNSIFHNQLLLQDSEVVCSGIHKLQDHNSKCLYIKSHKNCNPSLGYINYLQLFYCNSTPIQGYLILILWLLLLFYLLADTAAEFFVPSLEGLSWTLNLSPTIAGVTLLSIGNGANDIFSSLASFISDDDSVNQVGISSILGGAFFISSTVVGVICISIRPNRRIPIDKSGFLRDGLFLIVSLLCLLLIIVIGKINLWGAMCFLSLYLIYVFLVSTSVFCNREEANDMLLPLSKGKPEDFKNEIKEPLLGLDYTKKVEFFGKILQKILDLPLSLPRRLTIPVISKERWFKPYGVVSAAAAPIFLALIWGPNGLNFAISGLVGTILGILAIFTTERSEPPVKWLFPWLAGGFLMSITWTHILAKELVSLLVSLGVVIGISPSILGLTVLAWGNSLGDLVTNVTMARNGGPDGVQIAISGCYAGPVFNSVVGLGLSFCLTSWHAYPSYYILPKDPSVYLILGFLIAGLLWAIVILPKNNMRVDKLLGIGLLGIYLCFLFLTLARALGLLESEVSLSSVTS